MHFIFILAATIKHEWSKLQENYRKCLKKRELKTRSGAGSSKLPTCNFYNELHFLSDSLANKPSESNITSLDMSFDKNTCVEEESEIAETPEAFQSSASKRTAKKKEEAQPSLLDAAILQTLNTVNQRNKDKDTKKDEEKDADTLFCLSLVNTLKSLSAKKNALAKLKIQEVLFTIQFDD